VRTHVYNSYANTPEVGWPTMQALQFDEVNIRDERTIGEQIKSGFRLDGWILLTFGFILLLLGSTRFFLGKNENPQPIFRLLGACGLIVASIVMFVSVRRWVRWFFGALGYFAFRVAVALLLGLPRSPSLGSHPRLMLMELLALIVAAAVLCFRYLNHPPLKIEAAGLVGLVIAISFSVVVDANLPILSGVVVLALIQLANRRPTLEVS
jgi:hypothetical protein